jgi:cyclase
LNIPVIASGGGGDTRSFVDVFRDGRADAALAASIFHFGLRELADLKRELQEAGIPMRWPC